MRRVLMKIDDAIQWLNNRGHMFERADINKVALSLEAFNITSLPVAAPAVLFIVVSILPSLFNLKKELATGDSNIADSLSVSNFIPKVAEDV